MRFFRSSINLRMLQIFELHRVFPDMVVVMGMICSMAVTMSMRTMRTMRTMRVSVTM